jgi:hypothetical protein
LVHSRYFCTTIDYVNEAIIFPQDCIFSLLRSSHVVGFLTGKNSYDRISGK